MARISYKNYAILFGIGSSAALLMYKIHENVFLHECKKAIRKDDLNLRLVQIVFRHGARTPLSSPDYLPKIDYDKSLLVHADHTYVPYEMTSCGGHDVPEAKSSKFNLGQLTALGAEQMYNMGSSLRQHYISNLEFLSPIHTDEVYVQSTLMLRSIESARCTLAGLYPNQKASIPIQVLPLKHEVLIPHFDRCAYLSSLTRWAMLAPDLIEGMKEKKEEIMQTLGIPMESDVHIVTLRDCLVSHQSHGLLPEKFSKPGVLEKVDEAAFEIMDHVFAGYKHTREMALKLGIGPMLQIFLDNLQSSVERKSKTKMYLYSGHDATLMPLLHVLGIPDSCWTPFGANLTLELYESMDNIAAKEYYVRVLYKNEEKLVQGCDSELCPLADFQKSLSKFLISGEDYKNQCSVKSDILLKSVPKVPETQQRQK